MPTSPSLGRVVRTASGALTLLTVAVLTPVAAWSQQRIVTPSNSPWVTSLRGSAGSAQITGAQPFDGNGSLQLGTSGDLNDWGWYDLYAGDPGSSSFGLLGQLDHLSFNWFRASDNTPNLPVWQAQSVALRLYVRNGTGPNALFSELVWESYYNGGQPAPRDTWTYEDLTNQLFWRFVTGQGYTIDDCSNPPDITPGIPLKTSAPSAWATGPCYEPGAEVYGIGIGVGSNWPYQFTGFADDVQLGFNGQLAVNDNFELDRQQVTPEPATWVMMLTGLVLVGVVVARKRSAIAS